VGGRLLALGDDEGWLTSTIAVPVAVIVARAAGAVAEPDEVAVVLLQRDLLERHP